MKLSDVVFVTGNRGKLEEVRAILGWELESVALDLPEIQTMELSEAVRWKAEEAFRRLSRPVLVDDTALELDALAGFPGPMIRWMLEKMGADGISRMVHRLGRLGATARCAFSLFDGDRHLIAEGAVGGVVVHPPRGAGGFGWDSIFAPGGFGGRTYAELPSSVKNMVSHRRRALEALRELIAKEGGIDEAWT